MNIAILFIFLVSVRMLFFNSKMLKTQRQWHELVVLDYEKQIEEQVLKKEHLKSTNQSMIIFRQLDIIKQQIALLEVISNENNK
jgi:hypothetical protein